MPDFGDGGGKRYYGKYRGTVLTNIDPLGQGRLFVQVTDPLGLFPSSWAMPCVPWGGTQTGMVVVPPPHAGVWIEFEQGNPDYPIWTGFWWGKTADPPVLARTVKPLPTVLFLGLPPLLTMLSISDAPMGINPLPGITMQCGMSSITINAQGINIMAPKIQINGVTIINNGALTVMP